MYNLRNLVEPIWHQRDTRGVQVATVLCLVLCTMPGQAYNGDSWSVTNGPSLKGSFPYCHQLEGWGTPGSTGDALPHCVLKARLEGQCIHGCARESFRFSSLPPISWLGVYQVCEGVPEKGRVSRSCNNCIQQVLEKFSFCTNFIQADIIIVTNNTNEISVKYLGLC